jgi:hypothetical protein
MNRISSIALISALAACSSSKMSGSASGPATVEDYDDTAQAIGTMTTTGGGGGDVASMADAFTISRGEMPFGFGLGLNGDKHIHGNRLGLDYSYTAVCKDAAGADLAKCDKTADQAQIDVSWSGSLKTPNLDAEVSRMGSWTLTGLQSDTASLSGNSSFSLDTTLTSIFHSGATSSLSIDATAMYNAIAIATKKRQVTGGSATFSLTVHRVVTGTGSGSGSGGSGSGSDTGSGSGGSGSGGDTGSGSGGSGSGGSGTGSGSGSDDHGGKNHGGRGHDPVGHDIDKTFSVTATITFHDDQTAELVINGTDIFTIDFKTGKVTREPAP